MNDGSGLGLQVTVNPGIDATEAGAIMDLKVDFARLRSVREATAKWSAGEPEAPGITRVGMKNQSSDCPRVTRSPVTTHAHAKMDSPPAGGHGRGPLEYL